MNKVELKFIISYIKKAIFNLERANSYDDVIDKETLCCLKQTLYYYQNKLNKMEEISNGK